MTEAEEDSNERVARSLELLSHYSTENHPGHQPGRFVGPGPEYDGMMYDGVRWHLDPATLEDGDHGTSTALARLSEADQVLVTKFEAEGGLALCLGNAFKVPDRLRAHAKGLLQAMEGRGDGDVGSAGASLGGGAGGTGQRPSGASLSDVLDPVARGAMESAGLGPVAELMADASPVEQALLLFQAADLLEEREAVMRNVWSDVEFHGGEASNEELVSRLERQFASQLVRSADARLEARDAAKQNREQQQPPQQQQQQQQPVATDITEDDTSSTTVHVTSSELKAEPGCRQREDGIFEVALRGCSDANALARKLPERELNAVLLEPRNLGVALDLVGVYLKNYEIDKADLVITRVVPLCRQRGGTWLVKGLDKLSAVRMKQFRAYDSLVALKEIEQIVPFSPQEGWEFHDILYRNLAWCYSALDEPERCLEYTRKSVEVKRESGVPASWFDIWDLGKGHARLGQKTDQRDEMCVAYDLCCKAAEIHRTAEPSDRIMLAKILSNVGEIAMGIGDTHHLEGDDESSRQWYLKAEPSLREAYELQATALGPLKPLTGWAAGTVAHCMVRLNRWQEARDYLSQAFKVECTKDSTTPGSVIELLDRVLSAHQQLGDLRGMGRFADDIQQCIAGLRSRGWESRERDVFALLLHKAATAFLVGDDGTGSMIRRALTALREAETNLKIYLGASEGQGSYQCETCGKLYAEKTELEAHVQRRHAADGEASDGMDVAPKRFGPRADPRELLQQVQGSIRILQLGERAGDGPAFEAEPPAEGGGGGSRGALAELAAAEGLAVPAAAVGLGPAAPSDAPEDAAVALARSYALVGSWSDWRRFDELVRTEDGGSVYRAELAVPPGRAVEFQVVCDGSWSRRLFPAGNGGGGVLGPSAGGHGRNWRLQVPADGAMLLVEFNPTGKRYLRCTLASLGSADTKAKS
mmetsp:Transcript_29931/g.94350  ORF Transcript_29931/g.94350 Transcript_29931/m.94350 type:complete len:930 (+) Transcript_29931:296-3085(+)